MVKSLAGIALGLLAGVASAASPVGFLDVPFTPYTDAGPVGNDGLDRSELQWLQESTGVYLGTPVQSWLLVWDPVGALSASGRIRFDGPIVAVLDSRSDLISTAAFESPSIGYDYGKLLLGLEAADAARTSFSGDTLSLSWLGLNPGDHVRVLVAVPEPGTWVTLGAGLLGMGLLLRRRAA